MSTVFRVYTDAGQSNSHLKNRKIKLLIFCCCYLKKMAAAKKGSLKQKKEKEKKTFQSLSNKKESSWRYAVVVVVNGGSVDLSVRRNPHTCKDTETSKTSNNLRGDAERRLNHILTCCTLLQQLQQQMSLQHGEPSTQLKTHTYIQLSQQTQKKSILAYLWTTYIFPSIYINGPRFLVIDPRELQLECQAIFFMCLFWFFFTALHEEVADLQSQCEGHWPV